MRVSFGDFVFDGETRELLRSGKALRVPPKTFRMLEILLERRPSAVSKEDLMETLWPGVFITEGSLARVAAELRGILGDDGQEPRIVRTVPRFGYAFQADASDVPARLPNGAAARPRRRTWALAAIAVGGVALVSAFAAGRALERRRPSAVSYRRLTFGRGLVGTARLTPDGHTVVYTARWGGEPERVFFLRLESPGSQAIDLPGEADLFAVSRTGELAVGLGAPRFRRLGGPAATLATMPLVGGAPREVEEGVTSADWSPRGGLAVVRAGRLEFPAGRVLYGDGNVGITAFSPRGDRIAVLEVKDGFSVVTAVDLEGRRTQLARLAPALSAAAVVAEHVGLAWNAGGTEVLYAGGLPGRSNAILAVDLEGRTRVVLPTAAYASLRDVGRDGRLLLAMGDLRFDVLAGGAGEGRPRELGRFATSNAAGLTPDGTAVLINEFGEVGGRDGVAYLRRTDSPAAVKIAERRLDAISPDARWAARVQDGKAELIPTGSGEAKTLALDGFSYEALTWTPDGARLLVAGREEGHGSRLYLQDAAGGNLRAVSTEGLAGRACMSPDGTRVAVPQPDGLFFYPAAGGERRAVPGASDRDILLTFTEDGRALLVADRWRFPVEVSRVDLETGQRSPWRTLGPDDPAGVCGFELHMAPSGAWTMNVHRWTNDLYLVDGAR